MATLKEVLSKGPFKLSPLEKELAGECQCDCDKSRDIPFLKATHRPLSDDEIDRINFGKDKVQEALEEFKAKSEDNWKHRSEGMRCRTCIFFVLKNPDLNAHYATDRLIGRCRRHAPTMNGFPVVFDADWCGDHKLDENRV